MKTRSQLSLYLSFLWKSALISSLIMFTSMATGELLVDHNLFSGFLKKPLIWFGIFLETSIALISLYAFFYWPREWHLTIITPGLIFGWAIPGCLTLALLVNLSLNLRQSQEPIN